MTEERLNSFKELAKKRFNNLPDVEYIHSEEVGITFREILIKILIEEIDTLEADYNAVLNMYHSK